MANFYKCDLIYSGKWGVAINKCDFKSCEFIFKGPAQRTIFFLTKLYHGGGKKYVEATIENIRKGKHPLLKKNNRAKISLKNNLENRENGAK